ncbi:MAG TPA: hypothetical protein PK777_13805 [Thermoguttaceae bacterium]|nr:hypothetical protein [Thermoguttaceae bacterium]
MREASYVKTKIEAILAAKKVGLPVPLECAEWLGSLASDLYDQLASTGLVPPKPRLMVAEYLDGWLEERRKLGSKPATITALKVGIAKLRKMFGSRPLDSINQEDALAYVERLIADGLSKATIARRIQHARHAFMDAVRKGLVVRNPFEHVRVSVGDVSQRRMYIPSKWWKKCLRPARTSIGGSWWLWPVSAVCVSHRNLSLCDGSTWTLSKTSLRCQVRRQKPAPRHFELFQSIRPSGLTWKRPGS